MRILTAESVLTLPG